VVDLLVRKLADGLEGDLYAIDGACLLIPALQTATPEAPRRASQAPQDFMLRRVIRGLLGQRCRCSTEPWSSSRSELAAQPVRPVGTRTAIDGDVASRGGSQVDGMPGRSVRLACEL
jgi:hypothetical protein